jgi:hypothetical protein
MARARRWWNVGVVKIPHAQRDVAHAVLGARPGDRWQDIVGADTPDDHDRFPVGANCTYRAWLSDAEADRFRTASNVRYVVEDARVSNVTCTPSTAVPGWRVNRWIRSDPTNLASLSAVGVRIGLIDSGTSIAMRNYCSITMAARTITASAAPPTNDGYPGFDHASYSGSTAVPVGGTVLDAVTVDSSNTVTDAQIAQSVTWTVNNGAKVVNGSISYGTTPAPATLDALNAASGADVVFYFAMGNNSLNTMMYPAVYSTSVPYVYSVGAWDMSMERMSTFSNWDARTTGVAPGELLTAVNSVPAEVTWAGTSASTPVVTRLAARLVGGGATARAAGAALAATVQDMGQSPYQGRGRFDFTRAAESLGIAPPAAAAVDPKVFATSRPIPAVLV